MILNSVKIREIEIEIREKLKLRFTMLIIAYISFLITWIYKVKSFVFCLCITSLD